MHTRHVVSVNVAQAGTLLIQGRAVTTAYRKQPTPGRISVGPLGLGGDEQADLTVHGGLNKAVYAYPVEHYPFWQTVRAQAQAAGWEEPLPHGMLGENLTLQGLLDTEMWVGDVLRFPSCVLAVSEPRYPCFKFEAVMGFRQAAKMMAQSGWCGAYLAVRDTGDIGAGDAFELIPGPREVSISELFKAKMRRR